MSREERIAVLTAISEAGLYISQIADEREEQEIVQMLSRAWRIVSSLGYYTEVQG